MISRYDPEYVRAQKLFTDWCKISSLSNAIETAIHYIHSSGMKHSKEFQEGMHQAIQGNYSPAIYK